MIARKGATIAVIGGGLIGMSWAALFIAHGHDVALFDPDPNARSKVSDSIALPLRQIAALNADLPAKGRLHLSSSLADAVSHAAFIQENASESVQVKRNIYAQIEQTAPAGITIASSTSSLVWSDLSTGMAAPDRLLTAHPFNPPHLMPLVELYGPDAPRVQAAATFYRSLGRYPVTLKREAVGHIANRLSSALWREAVSMVAEGIADVAAIDQALVHGPGLRWSVLGSHMAYHLGGGPGGMADYLSHLGPSQERRWKDLGDPRLDAETQARLVAGVKEEAAGRDIATLESARDAGLIAVQLALREQTSLK